MPLTDEDMAIMKKRGIDKYGNQYEDKDGRLDYPCSKCGYDCFKITIGGYQKICCICEQGKDGIILCEMCEQRVDAGLYKRSIKNAPFWVEFLLCCTLFILCFPLALFMFICEPPDGCS